MKYLEDMRTEEKRALIQRMGCDRERAPELLLELQRLSKHSALDEATADLAAAELGMTPTEIRNLIGFYEMLDLRPSARYVLEICRSNPCRMADGQALADQLCRELGITPYEVTDDGLFTIRYMNCVGACDIGPVIRVGDAVYGNLTPEKIRALLRQLRDGK